MTMEEDNPMDFMIRFEMHDRFQGCAIYGQPGIEMLNRFFQSPAKHLKCKATTLAVKILDHVTALRVCCFLR
jgi:hypothetical protein